MTETDKYEEIKDRIVTLTKDLILIPGTVSRPDDIERCISYVKNYLNSNDNIVIHEHRHNEIPSLVAMPKRVNDPEILLVSHLDVIDHADVGVYNPRVKNGRIYGPGSGDMKGALSIMMELFCNFMKTNPKASLGLAITSDEERGGFSGIGYLFNDLDIRCGVAINPDGGGINEITIAEKGVVHLSLTCRGRSSHAARPWLGENALELLVERVMDLKSYFYSLRNDEDHWHPTCSLTVLNTENTTVNCIPSEARAFLDIRFPHPYTIKKILKDVKGVLGDNVEFEASLADEPMEFEMDPLFMKVIEEVTGNPASLVREDGASDCRFIYQHGIPVIISRPTVGDLHSVDEWIEIESMIEFYKICEKYLEEKLLKTQI